MDTYLKKFTYLSSVSYRRERDYFFTALIVALGKITNDVEFQYFQFRKKALFLIFYPKYQNKVSTTLFKYFLI